MLIKVYFFRMLTSFFRYNELVEEKKDKSDSSSSDESDGDDNCSLM